MAIPSATVTAYYGNNFDINNIPASPSVLESSSSTESVATINCLPLSGKSRADITVKAFNHLKETSYVKIVFSGDNFSWYATLDGYDYVSMDTVVLHLTIDAWLTCGGTSGITEISGLTKRHHVTDDTFGKYTQDDPLLVPRHPLVVRGCSSKWNSPKNTSDVTIIAATIDLYSLGSQNYNSAILYTESTESVVVPEIPSNAAETLCRLPNAPAGYLFSIPGVVYFDGNNAQVQRGVAVARSLGVENGIIGQFSVPSEYFDSASSTISNGKYISLYGKMYSDSPSNIIFLYGNNVKNNRLRYGKYNVYGIVSLASGNRSEFKAEDLYNNDSPTTSPDVDMIADPRQNGKPYFKFSYIKNMDANVDGSEFMNSIEGIAWDNAPINYSQSSGVAVKQSMYEMNKTIQDAQFKENIGKMLGSEAGSAVSDIARGAVSGGPAGALGAGIGSLAIHGLSAGVQYYNAREDYERMRAKEKAEFLIDTQIYAPEVVFPSNNDFIRDSVGNGVLVYAYGYNEDDLPVLDKILNMYGYADIAPLELSDFNSMTHFNYVEATDVHIKTSVKVSKTIRELCEAQISSGIRVWKHDVDDSYYTAQNRP